MARLRNKKQFNVAARINLVLYPAIFTGCAGTFFLCALFADGGLRDTMAGIVCVLLWVLAVFAISALLIKKVTEPYLKKLLYNDFLTGLPNRLAYEHRFRDYEMSGAPLDNVSIVIFDMNNLKEINDAYGHSVGDIALHQTAAIIGGAFKQYGGVYRIGGDEIAAFIEKEPPEFIQTIIDGLLIKEYFIYKDMRLDIACGAATFDPETDKNLHDIFDRADKRMYEHKKLRKTQRG